MGSGRRSTYAGSETHERADPVEPCMALSLCVCTRARPRFRFRACLQERGDSTRRVRTQTAGVVAPARDRAHTTAAPLAQTSRSPSACKLERRPRARAGKCMRAAAPNPENSRAVSRAAAALRGIPNPRRALTCRRGARIIPVRPSGPPAAGRGARPAAPLWARSALAGFAALGQTLLQRAIIGGVAPLRAGRPTPSAILARPLSSCLSGVSAAHRFTFAPARDTVAVRA